MQALHPYDPPPLFSWDVVSGAGGVTDNKERALRHVHRELVDAPPGTCATVRRVEMPADDGLYRDAGTIATARRDEETCSVVWT